jgi:hypothetical protein
VNPVEVVPSDGYAQKEVLGSSPVLPVVAPVPTVIVCTLEAAEAVADSPVVMNTSPVRASVDRAPYAQRLDDFDHALVMVNPAPSSRSAQPDKEEKKLRTTSNMVALCTFGRTPPRSRPLVCAGCLLTRFPETVNQSWRMRGTRHAADRIGISPMPRSGICLLPALIRLPRLPNRSDLSSDLGRTSQRGVFQDVSLTVTGRGAGRAMPPFSTAR